MASDRKPRSPGNIPIRFDGDEPEREGVGVELDSDDDFEVELVPEPSAGASDPQTAEPGTGGPAMAELVASRAELKRLQTALAETQDALTRRQADFENYRKRVERERSETHDRIVGDLAKKLLPVVDNLARALEAERSVEASESKEFRHFLHGVELISKQLSEVLESFGVEPIVAVGERFDPHLHEAVVTEPSEKYAPDTVTEELVRGYRIRDRLLRPAMVKVAAHKTEE